MARGSYQQRGSWRTSCGATRRFYVKTRIGQTWVTAGSADTEAQRDALVARMRARYPERDLRIVDGRRGAVVEETAATLAA